MIIVSIAVLTLIFSLPRPFLPVGFSQFKQSKPRINLKVNIEASPFIDVSVCDRFKLCCSVYIEAYFKNCYRSIVLTSTTFV